eukprot:EG_transcript_17945
MPAGPAGLAKALLCLVVAALLLQLGRTVCGPTCAPSAPAKPPRTPKPSSPASPVQPPEVDGATSTPAAEGSATRPALQPPKAAKPVVPDGPPLPSPSLRCPASPAPGNVSVAMDKGEQWRPPAGLPAPDPCTPDYCHVPPPDVFLNCSHSKQLEYGAYLGAGRSKTVVVATWRGRRFALKSSVLKGQVQTPKGQWPLRMRNAFLKEEYDIGVALRSTYGLQTPYGACFTPEGVWVAFRFGPRGEFSEALAHNASRPAALRMALSAAMLHACLERHRFGFAWLKDNGRKQYVVHEDWSLELVDIEGLQFYPHGHGGYYANKPCRTKRDCLANPNHAA